MEMADPVKEYAAAELVAAQNRIAELKRELKEAKVARELAHSACLLAKERATALHDQWREKHKEWKQDRDRLKQENERLREALKSLEEHGEHPDAPECISRLAKEALAADREPFCPVEMGREIFKDAKSSTKAERDSFRDAIRKDREERE